MVAPNYDDGAKPKPAATNPRKPDPEPIQGRPTHCSFCGLPADSPHARFNAVSESALVCCHCIRKFSIAARMAPLQRPDFLIRGANQLYHRIRKVLAREFGSARTKKVAASLAMSVALRSHRIFMARLARVPFGEPADRFFVKGGDRGRFIALLERALHEAGILLFVGSATNAKEVEDLIVRTANGDRRIAQHWVIFYVDGAPPPAVPTLYGSVCYADHPLAEDLDDGCG